VRAPCIWNANETVTKSGQALKHAQPLQAVRGSIEAQRWNGLLLTRRWRKTDSNSRSLREGKGYGQPLQASIAVFGPEPVSGAAFRAAVSDWQRPEEPFAGAGPMVRIRLSPAKSQQRTGASSIAEMPPAESAVEQLL
jgi:hypothetical protein